MSFTFCLFILIHYIIIPKWRNWKAIVNIHTVVKNSSFYMWLIPNISFEKKISKMQALLGKILATFLWRKSENYIIIFLIYYRNFTRAQTLQKKQSSWKIDFYHLIYVSYVYLLISIHGDIATKYNVHQNCLHNNI